MQLLFQGKSKALHFLPGLSYESNTGALYSPVRGLMGSRSYCLVGLEWHFACKDRACLLCSQKSERIFKGLNGYHQFFYFTGEYSESLCPFSSHHLNGGLHWSLLAGPQSLIPASVLLCVMHLSERQNVYYTRNCLKCYLLELIL